MGGSSFGEILSTALPCTDHSDSQSDRSSNSGEVRVPTLYPLFGESNLKKDRILLLGLENMEEFS